MAWDLTSLVASRYFLLRLEVVEIFPAQNVTVPEGRDVVLSCSVVRLGSHKVAWIHYDRSAILTVQNNVITRNPRISLSRPGENKWYLHLNSAQESDRGWYMCQINTDPMVHRSGYVQVVGKSWLPVIQVTTYLPP